VLRTRRHTLAALAGIRVHHGPARRDEGSADTGDPNPGGGGNTDPDNTGPDDTKTPEIKGDLDPDRAARAIAAARKGEKEARADAKATKDRLDAALKALGLTPDGKTDPAEQLKAAATERDKAVSRARDTAIELAVYKSAGKAGADPDAVLDSRGFLSSVAELDPDAADFTDKVAAAIKAAVKANPKLSATAGQGAGKQGADHTGGGSNTGRPKSLREAFARQNQTT
jgi:hypothetical protein